MSQPFDVAIWQILETRARAEQARMELLSTIADLRMNIEISRRLKIQLQSSHESANFRQQSKSKSSEMAVSTASAAAYNEK